MININDFSTISNLSGSAMVEAKKINLLANDLLQKFDLTNDEGTILRLEMILDLSTSIINQQEGIQKSVLPLATSA